MAPQVEAELPLWTAVVFPRSARLYCYLEENVSACMGQMTSKQIPGIGGQVACLFTTWRVGASSQRRDSPDCTQAQQS